MAIGIINDNSIVGNANISIQAGRDDHNGILELKTYSEEASLTITSDSSVVTDGTIVIRPSGEILDDGTRIRTALATGKTVYLSPGDYCLFSFERWPSDSILICDPGATLYYDMRDGGEPAGFGRSPIWSHWTTFPGSVPTYLAETAVIGDSRIKVWDPTYFDIGTRFILDPPVGGVYAWYHITGWEVVSRADAIVGNAQLSSLDLIGATLINTDGYKLYFNLTCGGNDVVDVYKNSAKTQKVATGTRAHGAGIINLTEENTSGLTGSVTISSGGITDVGANNVFIVNGYLKLDGAVDYGYLGGTSIGGTDLTDTRLCLPPVGESIHNITIIGNGAWLRPIVNDADIAYRAMWLPLAWDCRIEGLNVDASGCTLAGLNYDEGGVRNKFIRCNVYGNGSNPMHGFFMESSRKLLMEDCHSQRAEDYGISLVSGHECRIVRCSAAGWGEGGLGSGIYLGKQEPAFNQGCTDCRVEDCSVSGPCVGTGMTAHAAGRSLIITGCSFDTASDLGYQLMIDEFTDVLISGCTFRGGKYGLGINQSQGVRIIDTSIRGTWSRCAYVATGSEVKMQRVIVEPAPGPNNTQGIYVDGSALDAENCEVVCSTGCVTYGVLTNIGTVRWRSGRLFANGGGLYGFTIQTASDLIWVDGSVRFDTALGGTIAQQWVLAGAADQYNWGTFLASGASQVDVPCKWISGVSDTKRPLIGLGTIGGTPAGQPFESAARSAGHFYMKAVAGDTSTYTWRLDG